MIRYVTKVMVGTVCLVTRFRKEFALNFDEFLVERISSQLKNFTVMGKFSIIKLYCYEW